MVLYLYSGTPGSGKSLHTASVIYNRLRYHNPVIANFNINVGKIKNARITDFTCVDNKNLTPAFLRSYSKDYFSTNTFKEGAIFLVIDEAQILFNARNWNQTGRDDWLYFFSNHRKYGYDIVLVSQFDRMLDRQIRSLLEYEVIHRKVSNFGFGGKVLSLVSGGNLFVGVRMWYPLKERIGCDYFKAKKKNYAIYDTYDTFDDSLDT